MEALQTGRISGCTGAAISSKELLSVQVLKVNRGRLFLDGLDLGQRLLQLPGCSR
jgi:hypothetical protein